MIQPKLLLAAAAVALAASAAHARPMTATDMQSVHRVGAPEVSRDGRWAAFTVSDTDWAKNKRVNTLYLLDLTRPGATPQPTVNPLEEIIRGMLRPMLKQWLDEHLPQMVDEHVKREISRITGSPL